MYLYLCKIHSIEKSNIYSENIITFLQIKKIVAVGNREMRETTECIWWCMLWLLLLWCVLWLLLLWCVLWFWLVLQRRVVPGHRPSHGSAPWSPPPAVGASSRSVPGSGSDLHTNQTSLTQISHIIKNK